MKKFLWISIAGLTISGIILLSEVPAANHARQPAAPPAPAQAECSCRHLKALQLELRNALQLQQAFRGKVAELQQLDQAAASGEFSKFAAAAAKGLKRPEGDKGPAAVDYTPYGNTVDTGILKKESETPERRQQLCGLSRNAKQEMEDMRRGAVCAGIAKAVEEHEAVHWASCGRLGYAAFRDMHGADRAQEEVEAYGAQIKVLRDIINHLACGYRASGKMGDTVFAGVVCSLEQRFVIKNNNPFILEFEFAPSSATAGAWAYTYKNGVSGGGGGTYTIEGADTGAGRIILTGTGIATAPIAASSGGTVAIDLVPLESSECGGT